MQLVVNNDAPEMGNVVMFIPQHLAIDIISETLWHENSWLEKYTAVHTVYNEATKEYEVRFFP